MHNGIINPREVDKDAWRRWLNPGGPLVGRSPGCWLALVGALVAILPWAGVLQPVMVTLQQLRHILGDYQPDVSDGLVVWGAFVLVGYVMFREVFLGIRQNQAHVTPMPASRPEPLPPEMSFAGGATAPKESSRLRY